MVIVRKKKIQTITLQLPIGECLVAAFFGSLHGLGGNGEFAIVITYFFTVKSSNVYSII